MNPGSGDGRNYWGPLIVGGITVMAGAHGFGIPHHPKEEVRQSYEISLGEEDARPNILRAVHPDPKDKHTHQEEYSTDSVNDNFYEANTSGDVQIARRYDFLAGKSTIEVYGRRFIIPAR